MENYEKQELTREYIQRFKSLKYLPLYITGYRRFTVHNNLIVKKSLKSVVYGSMCLIVALIMLIHLVYETSVKVKYLLYTELVILMELSAIVYLFILNLCFGNRTGVAKIINYCIEIDVLLGRQDTKFLRDIVDRAFIYTALPVVIMQIILVTFLYLTFKVSMTAHITGSTYFAWLMCIFFDVNFLLSLSFFLTLRAKYLNVALMKYLNLKVHYVPDSFLLKVLYKDTKYIDFVTLHKKADGKLFIRAYKMLLNYGQLFQDCYRFFLFIAIICVTLGALFCVQTVITYGRTGIDMLRRTIVGGWMVLSWSFVFLISLVIDLFAKQINQTKLICTFAQMKYITDERVYQITKAILHELDIRDVRTSLYGVFCFEPAMLLRIAASTFVYVTAQLQITMPAIPRVSTFNNVTTSNTTIFE